MAETWMTYAELGAALGITAEAVRQKAIRARWRRQRDNMGKAQVLVDIEEVRTTLKPPRERVSDTRTEQPDEQVSDTRTEQDERASDARMIEALEAHIATLKETVAKTEAELELLQPERERADRLELEAATVPGLWETITAWKAAFETERGRVAEAEAQGELQREEIAAARKQLDVMVTELTEMSRRMADQVAATNQVRAEAEAVRVESDTIRAEADTIRAEFAAYRARSLWRRLVG